MLSRSALAPARAVRAYLGRGEIVPLFTKSGGTFMLFSVAEWSGLAIAPCTPDSYVARPFCHAGRKVWQNAPPRHFPERP